MSLVSAVITDIRVEINDTGSTRFSDDTTNILPIVKQAIRRANRICQIKGLQFAKSVSDKTTTISTAYVSMPTDFDVPIMICNPGASPIVLKILNEYEYEMLGTAQTANTFCKLDYTNSRIDIKGTPTDSTTTIRIYYYPTVDPSAYTTGSTMPWGGRLDDIISRYCATRLQNIDEMSVDFDQKLMADMETMILDAYRPAQAQNVSMVGWMENMG